MQRKEIATLGDGVVAIHIEDICARHNAHIERTVTASLDDITHRGVDNQLHLGAGRSRNLHINRHTALRRLCATCTALESHLLAHKVVRRINLHTRTLKDHEVCRRGVALTRQGHIEVRIALRRAHDVEMRTLLVTRNSYRTRSIHLTVEEVVLLCCGIHCKHIARHKTYIVCDVREMLEADIHRHQSAIILRIVSTHVRSTEVVILHPHRSTWHGVSHVGIINLR